MSTALMIFCILSAIVWLLGGTWFIMNPIERDRKISRGKFSNLAIVIFAIILLPPALTFPLSITGVLPEELAYEDDMYRKYLAYPFQPDRDSVCYTIADGDTTVLVTPRPYRAAQLEKGKLTDPTLLWTVYNHFFFPQDRATTNRGRVLSLVLSVLGMLFMTGLLISMITGYFQRKTERWQAGQIRYSRGLGRFCVVIGANEILANTIRQIDQRYNGHLEHIFVLTSTSIPDLRRNLQSELPHKLEKKVVLYSGQITEQTEISKLYCHEAEEVFVLGEQSQDCTFHDTTCLRCMQLIAEIIPQQKYRLKVHVLLNDACTYAVFQQAELTDRQNEKIVFLPFNTYESWARKVLVENHAKESTLFYEPLDTTDGIRLEDNKYVHLIVAGMTDMGEALAVETAHIAHFPNFARDHRLKTKITFVDEDIARKERNFKARYHELFELYNKPMSHLVAANENPNFLDIEWEFVVGSLKDEQVLGSLEKAIGENALLTLALCYDQQEDTLSTALSLPQHIYERSLQVLAYMPQSEDTLQVLTRSCRAYFGKLRPFGMTNCGADLSHKFVPLSKLVNYAYNRPGDVNMERIMQDEEGKPCDMVNTYWDKQTTANKWSNIYNSDSIPTKLRSVGKQIAEGVEVVLTEEDIMIIAEVEHRRWNMEKLLMHFRALTAEEQKTCVQQGSNEKKRLKNNLMAHLDICSLSRLREVDNDSVIYDEHVTKIIPSMIKEHFTPLPDIWS